ncbi:tripartite tricarboxylate transporter permease [Candidatus Woesearchaeota archaeon]|nr:tripartite tricarboxylate transporter permease [Candidatus Woesearchaeota archaeon]
MFLEILLAICCGVTAGIFTGLTPGIHINLVSVMLLSFSPLLLRHASPLSLACFIIAMSVVHTFLDSIPSVFLGAPDSDQALGVLPGHRYLLAGHGLKAVKLTLIGSFGAVILSILIFPVILPIIRYGYPFISRYIGYLLIATALFMIIRDNKRLWAAVVFFMAGMLGLIVLNMPNLKNPLFPLLSGLFGISTLLISILDKQAVPEQKEDNEITTRKGIIAKALFSGQFSGFITAVLPGLGAATAAVLSMQITRKLGDQGFMILIGSIGTVNFILSIATLYIIDKARNGSIIAVKELLPGGITAISVVVFLSATLISGGLGVILCLVIGRMFARLIAKINYRMLITGIIIFIAALTAILTGWIGMVILFVSTALGMIPAKIRITRTHCMGCLLLPVILYFMA